MVKKHVEMIALTELNLRKEKLSKISSLEYNKLSLQPYLYAKNTSNRKKRLQFRWRTRMVKVGWNFGNKSKCPLCNEVDDTQEHLLECSKIRTKELNPGGAEESEPCLEIIEAALRQRESLIEMIDKQTNNKSVK